MAACNSLVRFTCSNPANNNDSDQLITAPWMEKYEVPTVASRHVTKEQSNELAMAQ